MLRSRGPYYILQKFIRAYVRATVQFSVSKWEDTISRILVKRNIFINIAKGIQVYKLIHDYRLYEFEK